MTNIQFYVSKQSQNIAARLNLACRLAQKAYEHHLHVYVHCPDSMTARRLDDLLWTFNDTSFIPHGLHTDAPLNTQSPYIIIGYEHEPQHNCDYLINLANDMPAFFSRFLRMAEILDQTPEILQKGRERYKFYRNRGYNLEYHQA